MYCIYTNYYNSFYFLFFKGTAFFEHIFPRKNKVVLVTFFRFKSFPYFNINRVIFPSKKKLFRKYKEQNLFSVPDNYKL